MKIKSLKEKNKFIINCIAIATMISIVAAFLSLFTILLVNNQYGFYGHYYSYVNYNGEQKLIQGVYLTFTNYAERYFYDLDTGNLVRTISYDWKIAYSKTNEDAEKYEHSTNYQLVFYGLNTNGSYEQMFIEDSNLWGKQAKYEGAQLLFTKY